jgi:hypothetical protein
MKNKIIFKSIDKHDYNICLKPYPASKNLPSWWKDQDVFEKSEENPNGTKFLLRNGLSNATFKKCKPMLDAITSGYIIPLWSDIQVTQTESGPIVNWRTKKNIVDLHLPSSKNIEVPTGYSNTVFKYLNTWIPITPKGYSVLVTSPLAYRDLPIYAIPAVIDSDRSFLDLPLPCWIKKDFEGIIEKGTPIAQIIPFKREDWESEFLYFEDGEYAENLEKSFNSTVISNYIKTAWSKKNYK